MRPPMVLRTTAMHDTMITLLPPNPNTAWVSVYARRLKLPLPPPSPTSSTTVFFTSTHRFGPSPSPKAQRFFSSRMHAHLGPRPPSPQHNRGFHIYTPCYSPALTPYALLSPPPHQVPGGVGPMTIAMLLRNTVNGAIRAEAGRAKGAPSLPVPPAVPVDAS